jgi:ATP-dependent RNA helicase RhlE
LVGVPAALVPSFAALGCGPEILADLAELKFERPTPIQAAAIPVVLTGRDVIGIAQTGTGKTAAFCLPIIQRLRTDDGPRALVLSPTRELTLQTFECVKLMGKTKGFTAASIIGGEDFQEQHRQLAKLPSMVVGTPGRVLDLIERRRLDLKNVEVLVLDEADRLLDMGFADQIDAIIRYVPRERQTLLFSATMPSGIKALARAYMHEPTEVSVGPTMSAVANCTQELYSCTPREKSWLAHWLMLREQGQTLIFCRTKRGADELDRVLRRGGHSVGVLHADRTQDERNRSLAKFRSGEVRILVATDLASRGLDIDGIARVVNYDVPPTAEDYLHRIGRTARAQRAGTASTFVTLEDLQSIRSIESVTKQRIPTIFVKAEELLALARDLSARELVAPSGRDHSRGSHGGRDSRGPRGGHGGRDSRGSHDSRSSHGSHGSHGSHAPRGSHDSSSSHAPRSHPQPEAAHEHEPAPRHAPAHESSREPGHAPAHAPAHKPAHAPAHHAPSHPPAHHAPSHSPARAPTHGTGHDSSEAPAARAPREDLARRRRRRRSSSSS